LVDLPEREQICCSASCEFDEKQATKPKFVALLFATTFFNPQQVFLLYSWRVSRYSALIHWPVHCHMTSNSETVSRQMP